MCTRPFEVPGGEGGDRRGCSVEVQGILEKFEVRSGLPGCSKGVFVREGG